MKNEIIIYQNQDSSTKIEVRIEEETVWLNIEQISSLFGRDRTVINRHINNIFREGELQKDVVCAFFAQTTQHGAVKGKVQTKNVEYFNLDVIISVGYRVKSIQGTQFRIWANKVLKEYLLKGYAVSQRFERIENDVHSIKNELGEIKLQLKTSLTPERGIFFAGQELQMKLSGKTMYSSINFDKTLYTSPYLVMTEQEYTKHYFIEGERVCSKIGGGFAPAPWLPSSAPLDFLQGCHDELGAQLMEKIHRNLACADYHFDWKIQPALEPAHNESDEPETLQYFYHSDHLGSASFITDATGYVDQHIQYLPFGELFISQRNNEFDSRYKFTAKELDNETNYTYFGARYYDSDLSIWLSVDPLAHERSWLSPYNYCQWNPIGRIDPTGALDELYITGEDEAAVQESFNQLQSTTNLKLELNIETGQVTASGEAITEEDTRLMEVISDEKIKVNIEVQNPMFGEGAFLGTYYDVSTEQAETFNQYNPYNMKELETKHKAINGSGILHEITEGFEAGKITLQLKRGLQSAWRRIDVRTGEETYSPDYEHYETAHKRATPPPNEKRKKLKK